MNHGWSQHFDTLKGNWFFGFLHIKKGISLPGATVQIWEASRLKNMLQTLAKTLTFHLVSSSLRLLNPHVMQSKQFSM